jgi:cysteine protease ATG4
MELMMLAKDIMQRKQNPITYPCYILNTRVDTEEELNSELSKIFLFTYRSGFDPLPKSSCRTDKGWGCLARSCQMMIGRMLAMHFRTDLKFTFFRDVDEPEAPFSIHNLVRGMLNQSLTFQPNFWSPTQGCEAIRYAVAAAVNRKLIKTPVSVLVAEGGTVSHRDVEFRLNEMGSVMLLIPVRVGIKRHINQQTFMALEHMMQTRLSLGVIGGVPRRSYYLIGTCGQRLLYLDPHSVKPAMIRAESVSCDVETARTLPAVSWDRIDTSLLFGFFLKSHDDWIEFSAHVKKNTELCGIERLFYLDVGDGRRPDASDVLGNGQRAEDAILTWDSSDDDR